MSEQTTSTAVNRVVYQVSELNATVRDLLDQSFPLLWVEGEISNFARPRSGHWYFTLKDGKAQVRCAMFRNTNRLIRSAPQDGEQILVRAKVGLYAQRGEYQLVVQHMEAAGDGALQRAFQQLKQRLEAEGLFGKSSKQTLPAVPRCIGVITSGTGAALRDVLSVVRRRFPLGRVLLQPVPVQGQAAAPAIVKALAALGSDHDCDVILLVRGGGSLEDLWAFNEEVVARAIAACPVPIITGVGHETDFTIADFVADVRAPTPSAAAEGVCPDQSVWLQQLQASRQRLSQAWRRQLTATRRQSTTLFERLRRLHPRRELQQRMQRLDELEARCQRSIQQRLTLCTQQLHSVQSTLNHSDPRVRIRQHDESRRALQHRLVQAIRSHISAASHQWQLRSAGLHAVSPLATLERGYAIAQTPSGAVVTRTDTVTTGDRLLLTLRHGKLACDVADPASADAQASDPAS